MYLKEDLRILLKLLDYIKKVPKGPRMPQGLETYYNIFIFIIFFLKKKLYKVSDPHGKVGTVGTSFLCD